MQVNRVTVKVQYSTMIVKSLEESVKFYRDVLGFKEGYHVDLPNGGCITIMESEGASVELIENTNFPVGLYSIGTDVDDIDETIRHLENGYQDNRSCNSHYSRKTNLCLRPEWRTNLSD